MRYTRPFYACYNGSRNSASTAHLDESLSHGEWLAKKTEEKFNCKSSNVQTYYHEDNCSNNSDVYVVGPLKNEVFRPDPSQFESFQNLISRLFKSGF